MTHDRVTKEGKAMGRHAARLARLGKARLVRLGLANVAAPSESQQPAVVAQEPVCWIQSKAIKNQESTPNGVIWFPKPHHKMPEDEWTPLFAHPAPSVVAQLVDSLREVLAYCDELGVEMGSVSVSAQAALKAARGEE